MSRADSLPQGWPGFHATCALCSPPPPSVFCTVFLQSSPGHSCYPPPPSCLQKAKVLLATTPPPQMYRVYQLPKTLPQVEQYLQAVSCRMVLLEVLHAMLVMFVMLHVPMEKKPRETSVVPMWLSAGVEQLPACRLHSAGPPPPRY